LHITPALKTKLGYGEVRGSYLGTVGKTDHREARSYEGEVFSCDIDLFDAEKDAYPYPDGHFSTIVCCELLEHLSSDPMHLMAEINRVLKPGGCLVLSTPNICSYRSMQAILLGYHPGLFHQYVVPATSGTTDPRHSREYAPRDVQLLLEAAGFELARLETGPYYERSDAEFEWLRYLMKRYNLPDILRDDVIHAVGKKAGPVTDRHPAFLYVGSPE
jgi:SAM-dependent methyltransferase